MHLMLDDHTTTQYLSCLYIIDVEGKKRKETVGAMESLVVRHILISTKANKSAHSMTGQVIERNNIILIYKLYYSKFCECCGRLFIYITFLYIERKRGKSPSKLPIHLRLGLPGKSWDTERKRRGYRKVKVKRSVLVSPEKVKFLPVLLLQWNSSYLSCIFTSHYSEYIIFLYLYFEIVMTVCYIKFKNLQQYVMQLKLRAHCYCIS